MALPRLAYILLWFPKPSETFIFREVMNLWELGLPLHVYTLYGKISKFLSPEMESVSNKMVRLGIPFLARVPRDLLYWWKRDRVTTEWLFSTIPVRKWRNIEYGGENIWAFFCGFTLARFFEQDGIDHIHAPWANGPGTAAWVASKLTGIPFSFMGRAVDIYPPDGALREKIRDATFVRTNPRVNVEYLRAFWPEDPAKVLLSYDPYPLTEYREAPVPMKPPYRILAVGRLDRIKGFDVLLRAARILQDMKVDFHLTLAGGGPRELQLKFLHSRLGLGQRVSFPGYITHDRVSDLFADADIFVMSSVIHWTGERDGIPNVIVEAFLHRLPVVATDVAGIGEVVRNGETGYLVPQRDAAALALALRKMTQDREVAVAMADRGRALILEHFDPEKLHGELFQLFERVCREHPRKGK
jgi:colanic acid/amylovoran biosynthesis glycosyltransferase